jgi:hypothetical protein
MRKLLICLLLTGCLQPTEPTSTRLSPIAPTPETEPITEEPAPEPVLWTAPATDVDAEQMAPGNYTEQGKATNTLTIDSAGNLSGYSETTGSRLMPNGQWITVAVTCWFNGHGYYANDQGTGYWTFWYTMSSSSHTADQSANDCEKTPTQAGITESTVLIRFIDEQCIGVRFDSPTGEKVYCKE